MNERAPSTGSRIEPVASARKELPGVLLAAGEGRRFRGGGKLLELFRSVPLVRHALAALVASRVDRVMVVTGCREREVRVALGGWADHPRVELVHNPDWAEGIATSRRVAIERLPASATGALFLPADMPLMTSALVDRVALRFRETGRATFPLHEGEKGHPVALPRPLLSELAALDGNESGLTVIATHWDACVTLPLAPDEEHTQFDVDTIEDLRRLRAAERS